MIMISKILNESKVILDITNKRGNQITFTCPECGELNTYFSISPYYCESCKKELPDITNCIDSASYRLFYHRSYKDIYMNKKTII